MRRPVQLTQFLSLALSTAASAQPLPTDPRLVTGELDNGLSYIVMKHVDGTAHGGGSIVLDLGGLEYVSSAGLRCFMLASRQAKVQHGRIVVAALQPMVAEIFEISHFNLVFQVFPTVREAIGTASADALAAFEKPPGEPR